MSEIIITQPASSSSSSNIVATFSQTNQSPAVVGTTTLYTAPATGLYRITYIYLLRTTGGGNVLFTIAWTDNSGAQSVLLTESAAGSIGDYDSDADGSGLGGIEIKSGEIISYAIAPDSITGSPKYDFYLALERIV